MNKSTGQNPPPTVALALLTLLMLGGGFFAIVIVVIPGAVQMLAAGLLLTGFFVAQYFVWGRWLFRYVVEKEKERVDAEQALKGTYPTKEP